MCAQLAAAWPTCCTLITATITNGNALQDGTALEVQQWHDHLVAAAKLLVTRCKFSPEQGKALEQGLCRTNGFLSTCITYRLDKFFTDVLLKQEQMPHPSGEQSQGCWASGRGRIGVPLPGI